jgi:very-short-patch-repair endonuclease
VRELRPQANPHAAAVSSRFLSHRQIILEPMPTTRNSNLRENSRKNRSLMNEAEVRIWMQLRRQVLDAKFRRQHPVGPYILDFACVALRIAIELDGSQHDGNPEEAIRDAYLSSRGWIVLHFWSGDALANTDGLLDTIVAVIEQRQIELAS